MATNKETSVGIKLVADLRNYQTNLSKAQTETKKFGRNVKQNIGDVKNSFAALMRGDITALPGFFRSATTAAGGFAKGLNGVKVALISTGIGALLVGIGLAIASITQYFKGTEEGQIVFKKVMNNIKAYTEPVLQLFGSFGKALVHLFKGEFGQAWDTAKGALAGVGDQIKANKEQVGELNNLEEKYIKDKRKYLLENRKLEADVAELRRKANQTDVYSAAQRAKFSAEAIDKQKQWGRNQQILADEELKIAETKASFGDNDIATNDHLAELKARQFEITKATEDRLRTMVMEQKRINKELTDQITQQQAINAAIAERAASKGMTTIQTKQVASLDSSGVDTTTLADMGDFLDDNTKKLNNFQNALNQSMSATDQIGIMSQAFGQLGMAIGGVGGSWLQTAASILSMIPTLITQITALTTAEVAGSQAVTSAKAGEAIASGTAESQKVPFPFNIIALAATIASIVAALATRPKMPALASGGIAYGDTIARVGEYSNARANPEVIAPLNKLKTLLPGNNNQDISFHINNDFDGERIVTTITRIQRRQRQRT